MNDVTATYPRMVGFSLPALGLNTLVTAVVGFLAAVYAAHHHVGAAQEFDFSLAFHEAHKFDTVFKTQAPAQFTRSIEAASRPHHRQPGPGNATSDCRQSFEELVEVLIGLDAPQPDNQWIRVLANAGGPVQVVVHPLSLIHI